MIILTYDISSDKKRAKFSKFIGKYGVKLQYSVYKIKNSKRIMDNILSEIDQTFKKDFDKTDSVYIFYTCEGCDKRIVRYGSSVHEETDVVYLE